jgi:aspartate/methionine/tyrosine aminotransferase
MTRYDLEYHDGWSIDFGSFERALSSRTRAVLIVNPNNPTGSFVSATELDRIAASCADRGVAIIADEVFSDYELEPGAACRAGRAAARSDALAFSLGGLSKSVGLPQVKLGWIAVAGPEALADAALERLDFISDAYLSVSTPVQVAAADLVERGRAMRAQIAARIGSNYRRLRTMAAGVPSCRVQRADGGWYAVLQVPSLESEEDLVLGLLERDGVLAHPGYFFDFPGESFLVVSLLTPEAAFTEGIARVLRHFDCAAASERHG